MAEFGFDSDPFANMDKQKSPHKSSKSSSSRSKEGSSSSRKPTTPSSSSSSRDRDGKDKDRDKERKHRSSKDRDRERDRSSDRDKHHTKSLSSSEGPHASAFEPSFDAFHQNDANNFGYETHEPDSAAAAPSPPPPESRMRRMRRASVTAGTTGSSIVSGDAAQTHAPEIADAPAGRIRRTRRASLVGGGDASAAAAAAAAANNSASSRRILQSTRSSDGLEDMRHNARSGLPEGHNVAPPKRRGRRASLVGGSGGMSVRNIAGEVDTDDDYGYGDAASNGEYGYGEDAASAAADQVFLEERTDRQRKLLDKFRNMDVHADDDASVMSPRKESSNVTVSAVRTDLMLQSTQQAQPRARRRASLVGVLSGVVGGGASAMPEPMKDEPEKKAGARDRRSMRSKSASGDLMVNYDPTRERTRGAGLLDRVGAARTSGERTTSGGAGSGTNYSDRIMQGR
ncbi:hypothetical protein MPSEU_000398100 [Mayamaea pseudoterrestris]|nr:hypothetical protein MPSEU_000398100 [Mayamaea pseudoterrestris]